MRVSSDSFDISSEKTATALGFFGLVATCWAMFKASAVFPMAGRAARMNSSPSRRPPVISSNFRNPVLMPLMRLLVSRKALMPPSYSVMICAGLASEFFDCTSPSFMNASSTAPRICFGSSSHVKQRLMVSCETRDDAAQQGLSP